VNLLFARSLLAIGPLNAGAGVMRRFFVAIVIFSAICFLASPVAAIKITLIGEVNENDQIVADNEVYEVDDNDVGDDLVVNHIAQKVKVVGILKETRKFKIITVESFEVVEE
jgi:hypothetical protein